MANKYLIDLDLNGNEIQNVAIQTTGTLPSTPVNGQIVNHNGEIKVYNLSNTTWVTLGKADGTTITQAADGTLSVGSIAVSNVSGLQSALDSKVDDSQVQTNVPSGAVFTDTQLTQEQVEDMVGSLITDSGATTVNYDDNAGTLEISSTDTLPSSGDGIDVTGASVAVDSTVVRTSGAQTIGGNKTFSNDVAINGDLTVSGNVTSKLSEEVLIEDNMVVLNSNETGTPTENAGIEVERGTSANASLFWAESQGRWYMNTGSSTEPIPNASDITAASSDNYVDGATFNSGNGELTLSVGAQSDVVVDLDGRYLTSYTETDPVFSASAASNITTGDLTNYDAAFGWGDHSAAGYLTSVPNAGIGAGSYGSANDSTKIDTITVDAQGRITAIGTGPVVDNNTQRTDEEIRDLVADVMVGNATHTGIVATDDDGNNAVNLANAYNYADVTVSGHAGGNFTIAEGDVNISMGGAIIVQVYEDNGSGIQTQVHTKVTVDNNNNEVVIFLPAGDYRIAIQGDRV